MVVGLSTTSVGVASGVAATYQGSALGAAAPAPTSLTARVLKRYSVPLSSSVTVNEVVSASLLAIAVQAPHETPAQRVRYSYPVMVESAGSSHARVTLWSPAVVVRLDGAAGGVLGAHAHDVGLGVVGADGDAASGVVESGETPALRVVGCVSDVVASGVGDGVSTCGERAVGACYGYGLRRSGRRLSENRGRVERGYADEQRDEHD